MIFPTARQIATDVQSQKASPARVANEALNRAHAVNPRLNALTVLNAQILDDARAIDARVASGERLPLAGAPIVIKDNIWVMDLNITNGSRLFADFKAPKDAVCVTRLREAGAVILGIGTCSEFACKGVTNTPLHGITRHPVDPDLTPGGSSGGPAVAVAAGIAPLAIGTDAGGSSRRPPAHVGVVGFKPNQDAIPHGPGFGEPVWGISTICPIAQDAADAALAFSVLSKMPEVAAPTNSRFAYAPKVGLKVAVDDDVSHACKAAVSALSHTVQIENAAPVWSKISQPAAITALQFSGLEALYVSDWNNRPELFDPDIGVQIETGLALTGIDVAPALQSSQAMRAVLVGFLSNYDYLVTPTTTCASWPVTQLGPNMIDGKAASPRDHAVFTPQANHTGLPAITIPCGFNKQNLPVGFQIIGSAGSDSALLAIAQQFEPTLHNAGLTQVDTEASA